MERYTLEDVKERYGHYCYAEDGLTLFWLSHSSIHGFYVFKTLKGKRTTRMHNVSEAVALMALDASYSNELVNQ